MTQTPTPTHECCPCCIYSAEDEVTLHALYGHCSRCGAALIGQPRMCAIHGETGVRPRTPRGDNAEGDIKWAGSCAICRQTRVPPHEHTPDAPPPPEEAPCWCGTAVWCMIHLSPPKRPGG